MLLYISKPIERTPPRTNADVNHGLSVMCIRQGRLTDGNKCSPSQVGTLIMGEAVHVGPGGIWEISILL